MLYKEHISPRVFQSIVLRTPDELIRLLTACRVRVLRSHRMTIPQGHMILSAAPILRRRRSEESTKEMRIPKQKKKKKRLSLRSPLPHSSSLREVHIGNQARAIHFTGKRSILAENLAVKHPSSMVRKYRCQGNPASHPTLANPTQKVSSNRRDAGRLPPLKKAITKY